VIALQSLSPVYQKRVVEASRIVPSDNIEVEVFVVDVEDFVVVDVEDFVVVDVEVFVVVDVEVFVVFPFVVESELSISIYECETTRKKSPRSY